MSKHTKGPWIARQVGGAGFPGQIGYAIDFNEDQEQVVDFVYEEADARLIAAAPELLEALKWVIERNDAGQFIDGECMKSARAAIAKATA